LSHYPHHHHFELFHTQIVLIAELGAVASSRADVRAALEDILADALAAPLPETRPAARATKADTTLKNKSSASASDASASASASAATASAFASASASAPAPASIPASSAPLFRAVSAGYASVEAGLAQQLEPASVLFARHLYALAKKWGEGPQAKQVRHTQVGLFKSVFNFILFNYIRI
jgi:hypothetical protein